MDANHLRELLDLEEDYWWHVAKRRLVTSILTSRFPPPGRVVEGGIGSSRNLIEFERLGYEGYGLDVMPEAVSYAHSRGLSHVWEHDLQEPWPVPARSARAVVMLDVLEHVADPVTVLRHAAATLGDAGGMIVTVPAYPWLYGDWDRQLGHHRRYTSQAMRQQVRDAGLNMERLGYWNIFTLPAALALRLYQKVVHANRTTEFPRVSPMMNRMLLSAAAMERPCARLGWMPCGLSLVGIITP
jgi:SAM-dependent methyltransferase